MVYPEGERRIIKIRRNHRSYQDDRRRKKQAAWFLIIGILLAAALAAGFYFNLPKLAVDTWTAYRSKAADPPAAAEGEPAGGEAAAEASVTEEAPAEVEEPQAEPVTVMFTGDVWLDPAVQENYDAAGIDGVLDAGLLAELTGADICVINNEFAFSTQGQQANKQYTYRVDPKYVTILSAMGVDVAGLANNHALDFGTVALSDTFATLDGAQIKRIGAGDSYDEAAAPAVIEAGGQTYAFLAATHVIPEVSWNVQNRQPGMFSFYDETGLLEATTKASEQYDHVFVLAHWGSMRTTDLVDYQVNDGRKLIDAGAEAVIGAHPHVLQGIEGYNGGYVFYSLGDFISTNRIEQTMAVAFTIDGEDVSVRLVPAACADYRTVLADEGKAKAIFDMLQGISTGITIGADGTLSMP